MTWSYATGGAIESSPVISTTDGTVYVGSEDGNLYAVSPGGVEKWASSIQDYVSSSPALGSDGTIYVGDVLGLYAIDPADGTQKWNFLTLQPLASSDPMSLDSSPVIGSDGTIYLQAYDGYLYAIDEDGDEVWSSETDDITQSMPAVGPDGTVYLLSSNSTLYAFNSSDGSQQWTLPMTTGPQAALAVGTDGIIYASSGDSLSAIKPDSTSLWNYPFSTWVGTSPVIGPDGTIYVATSYTGSTEYGLYALAASKNPVALLKSAVNTSTGSLSISGYGDTVTYTLSYANTGQDNSENNWLTGVQVTDTLPSQVTYVPGSASGGTYNNGTITWGIGDVVPGGFASLTFQATVNTGLSSGAAVTNTASVTCTQSTTAIQSNTASFNISTYTVTTSAGANGAISPTPSQAVVRGGSFTFTATPNTGFVVDTWSVDGVATQTGENTFILSDVTANHSVSVTFKVETFPVTPSAGANGSISPNTVQTVNYNGSFAFHGYSEYPVSGRDMDGRWYRSDRTDRAIVHLVECDRSAHRRGDLHKYVHGDTDGRS